MKQFFKMVFASCLGVILAGGVLMFLFFMMLTSVISSGIKAIDSRSEKAVSIQEESILEIAPIGNIADGQPENNSPFSLDMLGSEKEVLSLWEIKTALKKAADDPKIEAVSLDFSSCSFAFGTAQELAWALKKFKEDSGKKVYAYSALYTNASYLVASLADHLYLNPEGVLALNGLASNTLFYTGPLKKLGVEMQVFKVGTFKGAVEPFVREELSPENRLQIQQYLDGLWAELRGEIALNRNMSEARVDEFANGGMTFSEAKEYVASGLIDSLVYSLDMKPLIARDVTGTFSEEEYHAVSVKDFLKSQKPSKKDKAAEDKIAYILAEGEIKENLSSGPFQPQSSVVDLDIARKLRKVYEKADEEDIKAVVMRVNSPGGSAYLSEQIWKEVENLRKKIPVVVSMGNYAASGGYYISSAATKIIAEPTTLTGSIGIFGMFPNLEGTAKKIDLKHETVKTHAFADLGNQLRPMRPEERLLIQNRIEKGYELFLRRVADGRGMSIQQVDSIGQGRVWLGKKAVELGLVDALGGLDTAFQEAARLADVDDYSIYKPQLEKKEWWEKLLGGWARINTYRNLQLLSPTERKWLQQLRTIEERSGILAMPYEDITAIR